MSDHALSAPIHFPTIHMIFSTPGLPVVSAQQIRQRIAAIHTQPGEITVEWTHQDPQKCLGRVRFAEHDIQVAGLLTPLSVSVVDQTVLVSPWPPQIKAAMRHHQAHLSLVNTGSNPNPVNKMTALYSVASAHKNENLLGIVNQNAWTAHPAAKFLSPEKIARFPETLPFILWVGYVKFYIDENHFWLVSKGHHIFDVPDLAYFVSPGEDLAEVKNLFMNVFYYLYEKDVVVSAGDTLSIGIDGADLQFAEVTELADVLMGPSGTLVIEKATSD